MTTLEIIETTFKALHKRTDEAFETVEGIKKQHDKTTSGMNNVVDTIREMREKVRNLMSLQDDIAHQFKNVDKLVMGNAPGDFEPVKRVKKETKKSSFDDVDYKPASKVKFDALSDDEDYTSKKESVKSDELSDEEPAKEEPAADEDAERAAALEEAKKLEAEFEADEAALEAEEGEDAAAEEAPAEEVDEEAEARRIAELELQQLAEEEAKLAEEELKRLEEEEKRLAEEEELKRLEEEEAELKRLQEEEAALKAEEEELRRLEEEEAAAKAEEDAKKAAEEEAKKKAPGKGKAGKFQFGNQLKTGAGNKNKVVFK